MAKKAPMSLGTMTASPPPVASPEPMPETTTKKGRPRTLPDTFKTTTIRLSPAMQKALRLAALNHDRSIQSIILDGIADQLARLGVVVEE